MQDRLQTTLVQAFFDELDRSISEESSESVEKAVSSKNRVPSIRISQAEDSTDSHIPKRKSNPDAVTDVDFPAHVEARLSEETRILS